jgi:hypothetical protein
MSFLIERLGPSVRPHAQALVQHLPALWADAEQHNLLRCAIITTLTLLVQCLGPASSSLYPFLVPVLSLACDPQHEEHVYLGEDALALWLAALEAAEAPSAAVTGLFSHIPSLLVLV